MNRTDEINHPEREQLEPVLRVINEGERRRHPRGFVLVTCLLLLVILSVISIGLLMMVNTEGRVGGNDMQNTLAYHAAEGGMERATSDLIAFFQTNQAPQPQAIRDLTLLKPAATGTLSYPDYTFTPAVDGTGALVSNYGQIKGGPNDGLFAQLIPVTLQVTAQTGLGAQATLVRTVQIALIPVFQFGVFSDSSLGFYNNPDLVFSGRIQSNGDIFLAPAGGALAIFQQKVAAYGNIIRTTWPNGIASSATGLLYVTNSSTNGCPTVLPPVAPTVNCRQMGMTEGSLTGGIGSSMNTNWPTISTGTYNSMIVNGNDGVIGSTPSTGAVHLGLSLAGGTMTGGTTIKNYEIIRRPPTGEDPTSALSVARLYNKAAIRVLLSDDPAELPGGAADPQNIRLANVNNGGTGPDFSNGIPTSVTVGLPALASGQPYTTYFAEALTTTDANWITPTVLPAAYITLTPTTAPLIAPPATTKWNLLDGYLRVEIRDKTNPGTPLAVTREWLQLGFARNLGMLVGGAVNDINPTAILLFQLPADRTNDGTFTPGATPAKDGPNDAFTNKPYFGDKAQAASVSRNNWYPINFYDTREGEVRDIKTGDNSCTVNGIMNAVELDVANLKTWLTTVNGLKIDPVGDNGYILYFSDRRGMLANVTAGRKTGDSNLEDSINKLTSASGAVDRILDPATTVDAGVTYSSEDVNENGVLDNIGALNLGSGFGINTGTTLATANQYGTTRIGTCVDTGRKNRVSGARHVLRLVDGALGKLPLPGFTVASENPVYILGNYNTGAPGVAVGQDPSWTAPNTEPSGVGNVHAAAAVVADAVSLLSNAWTDRDSFSPPTDPSVNRVAVDTYYRTAIAMGKNMTFQNPGGAIDNNFGADGGVGNFLRFLEDWNAAPTKKLYYKGSMVSLFYSTYATGTFKCCTYSVYMPPNRNYFFDTRFTAPSGIPPGTPMLRDVDTLGTRQDFTPH